VDVDDEGCGRYTAGGRAKVVVDDEGCRRSAKCCRSADGRAEVVVDVEEYGRYLPVAEPRWSST